MAEALAADPAELEAMGRAGAARVAERHAAAAEAGALAALIARPATTAAREDSPTAPALAAR
jgi:hypothetical protein